QGFYERFLSISTRPPLPSFLGASFVWALYSHRHLAPFGFTDHWSLALFPRRSPLVTLNCLHWPLFSRPAPHAGISGFRSCPDPSPLATASHRRPTAEGKDRTGPDLNERSLSLSMAPNRAISTEKS